MRDRETSGNNRAQEFSRLFDLERLPEIPPSSVTAIVLCHNEALRLPHFLDYHKAHGIGHFLVVDNASTDGSSSILDNDPHVTRFPSQGPYSELKSLWREFLADHYLVGKWAAFLDVDELLLHPTSQNESLPDYVVRLETAGFECLLTVMVDMYPSEGDMTAPYEPGTPFLDHAPFFDTGNYRIESYTRGQLARYPTPAVVIRGGARERLFHRHPNHEGAWYDRMLNRLAFPMTRRFEPGLLRILADKVFRRLANRMDNGPGLPNMSKLALIRWREGSKFSGGPHRIDAAMKVAPDLGALLHFKYLGDFAERAAYNAVRGQHAKGAAHYRYYASALEKDTSMTFGFKGTRRFTGPDSLKRAGLLRSLL